MRTRALSDFIGTEITGVTSRDLTERRALDEVLDLVHRNELVVVRDIELTPAQQVLLAARIGQPVPLRRQSHPDHQEIMVLSNEIQDGKPVGVARAGNFWHQDSSCTPAPETYTLLHGVDVPSTTGHTLFASAADVYDRLPSDWRGKVTGRTALHTAAKRLRIGPEHLGLSIAELRQRVSDDHPRVPHDLVRHDPHTGRRFLYGAPEFLDSVVGFSDRENEEFLALIDGLIQDPDHVYTHRWRPRDLVLWKTATTYHSATELTPGTLRRVHRVSIRAEAG
jgi:taurine dioxygenase